jgi:hypothetical protein
MEQQTESQLLRSLQPLGIVFVMFFAMAFSCSDQSKKTSETGSQSANQPLDCSNSKAPARGAITSDLAKLYFICQMEKVSGQYLYLVENVNLEVGSSRPYNPGQESAPEIDPTKPMYAIRGSYMLYHCNEVSTILENAGKNCAVYVHRKATGYCYTSTFGEWLCNMTDGNISNDDYHSGVPPPHSDHPNKFGTREPR